MLSILDRYIIKELFGPFLFGMAAFTFILAGSTVLFPMISESVKYGIPPGTLCQIILYKLPNIIVYTFPMTTLLATIMAFSRLSSDLEILAFRSGGISFFRLFIPVVVIGLLISLTTIWFNESIVPKASHSAQVLFQSYRRSEAPTVKKNINLTEYDKGGLPSRIINIGEIKEGVLQSITIAEFEIGHLNRLIRSNTGKWLPEGGWEFYNGVMHNFSQLSKKKVTVMEFEKEYINIKINPFDIAKREKKVEELSTKGLKERIKFKKESGQDPTEDLVNYHMKFAVPFASLIFAILGVSVGLRPHRSSSALGLGISLVVILIYYILLALGMALGLGKIVPPIIAAWMPNIIIGLTGLNLLRKISSQ